MTFSIVAALPHRGLVGLALASSAPVAGSRCAHIRGGVGAVASQAHTDPALGTLAIERLADGDAPDAVLGRLAGHPFFERRQLAMVDAQGRVAAHTGPVTEPERGQILGDGFAVIGNHLVGVDALEAVADAFRAAADDTLERRLVRALRAGHDAGGDRSGSRSAALLVASADGARRTDLRADWRPDPDDDAVAELERLVALWVPLVDYYRRRPTEPDLGPWDTYEAPEEPQ